VLGLAGSVCLVSLFYPHVTMHVGGRRSLFGPAVHGPVSFVDDFLRPLRLGDAHKAHDIGFFESRKREGGTVRQERLRGDVWHVFWRLLLIAR
jgi:hypothetical protein